jgi:hypothetical protein
MTEQEQADLTVLQALIKQKKEALYSYLGSLDTMKTEELVRCGYTGKTNADAMQDAFRRFKKDIDKAIAAHVKKYPDK